MTAITRLLPARGPLVPRRAGRLAQLALPDSALALDIDRLGQSLPEADRSDTLRLSGARVEMLRDGNWSLAGAERDPGAVGRFLAIWEREIDLALSAPLLLHRLLPDRGSSAAPAPHRATLPPDPPTTRDRADLRAWRRQHSLWLHERRTRPAASAALAEDDWASILWRRLEPLPRCGDLSLHATADPEGELLRVTLSGFDPGWSTGSRFRADPPGARLIAEPHPLFDSRGYITAAVASLLIATATAAFRSARWQGVETVVLGPEESGRTALGTLALTALDRELTLLDLAEAWPEAPDDADGRLVVSV